jgi:carotenoid 1,2-hydratase
MDARIPGFDVRVAAGGYAWWYVDALSDDGTLGLTLIAFVGSVFSPYYAWARRGGDSDPRNHVALNVALYGTRGKRWAMTERGRGSLRLSRDTFVVGPSTVAWRGDALCFDIDEVSVPWPGRLRGSVRVHPQAVVARSYPLDVAGRHRWCPIAPAARVEVDLARPGLRWSGHAYVDSNFGDEPVADPIRRWHWSRTALPGGTAVMYDVEERDGRRDLLALRFSDAGDAEPFEAPPERVLPRTGWRIHRATRAEGGEATVLRTLEDTPFYARSLVRHAVLGQPREGVHESLDLDRFRSPVVQAMLPFRMPRRTSG